MPTTGEALVRLLKAYGVELVFGIPGVHTVELYRGLPATGIRHVTPRHEQGAGFMADGYARVSGRPGVCFVITGPGMTNILTAMGQAYADSVPLLVISAVNRTAHLGMGQGRLHELLSQREVASGVAAFSHTLLDPGQLPEVMARAFALFASARPRPVHIEIPTDVIARAAGDLPLTARPLPSRPAADPGAIDRAATLLQAAKRPFVILGGGAVEAVGDVAALVEALDAPAFCTINAKGLLPPGHRLAVPGNLGVAPLREALAAADAVLVVGSELGETEMYPDPQPLRAGGTVIRIDIDPMQLMRTLPADVPICADARLALQALNAALEPRSGNGAVLARRLREAVRAALWPSVAVHERIMAIVAAALPDVVVVGDSAEPVYAANQVFEPARPRSFFNSSTGYGTLGYGLPAAIGAQLAAPERPVVCLCGDGGLQFTLPELAAAVEAGAPVIVLVWNNRGYGEIKAYMRERGIPEIGVDLHTPDFPALARGFGGEGVRLEGVDRLADALRAARTQALPSLIELRP